jgi:hypothetical protein
VYSPGSTIEISDWNKPMPIASSPVGGFGQGLHWEWQLLALKEGTR